jgi:hypothetical protein
MVLQVPLILYSGQCNHIPWIKRPSLELEFIELPLSILWRLFDIGTVIMLSLSESIGLLTKVSLLVISSFFAYVRSLNLLGIPH